MNVIKRYWFAGAVTLLVGVIAFNVYTVYNHTVGNPAPKGTAEGPGEKRPSTREVPAEAGPGVPRSVVFAVAPKDPDGSLDADRLKQALLTIGPVKEAHVKSASPTIARLTIIDPVKLSLVEQRLEDQGAKLVENRSPLRGRLRLHVSGMT